ncbi:MAG TPA: tyrosine-protein phosphatase [Geobacterales bacterium]|nr:tyrosine-protein phosphatase [Geobacterales bacterium]
MIRLISLSGIVFILTTGAFTAWADGSKPNANGCAAAPFAGARISEHVVGLPGLSNVGRVAPGIYRGAQPDQAGYATLKAMGIKTVINLRYAHTERQAVESAGMRSIEIPINMFADPDPATFSRIVALMVDPANQPVFLHCAHGKDRTGTAVSVYRMTIDGWTPAEAEAEMQDFGFNDIWLDLHRYVVTYPNGGAGTKK